MRAGHARLDQGDVGAMHPIGTRETLDGMTLSKYAVGKKVSSQLSRRFVHILARIGSVVFPDVLSVIQDTWPVMSRAIVMEAPLTCQLIKCIVL